MREQDPAMHDDEQDLARLLRAAGQRARPSAQAMEEVRLAVEAEWRATVAARNRRRQWTYMSAAASVAVAAVALWNARPLYLAAGFMLEEGFTLADLKRIVESMAAASRERDVHVLGDSWSR